MEPTSLFREEPIKQREIQRRVSIDAERALGSLEPHLAEWLRMHLVPVRQEMIYGNSNGSEPVQVWFVTDHIGREGSSYRIVYDTEEEMYGLEMTMQNGVHWMLGLMSDDLADTVRNM